MPARIDKIANYSDALIAISKANNALDEIEVKLSNLLEFMDKNENMKRFLASTTIDPKGKQLAMHEILEGQTNPLLINFISMLLAANDLPLLKNISEAFFDKSSKENEHLSGEIHSAVNLTDPQVIEIEKEVGRILNKNLKLQQKVIPGIMGGVLVKVGDFVVDGTIDCQLNEAKQQLLA